MNEQLYTDEFRAFKMLQLNPALSNLYHTSKKHLNRIRPPESANDQNFQWPCLVEFVDQLLDLKDDTIYIVDVRASFDSKHRTRLYPSPAVFVDDLPKLIEIKHPGVFRYPAISSTQRSEITLGDIKEAEDVSTDKKFLIGSRDGSNDIVVELSLTSIIPLNVLSAYCPVFYKKEWAQKYQSVFNNK